MTAENHPDPFQDAIGNGVQRAVQVTSCAVTAAQVYLHQQRAQAMVNAERDEQARRALTAQMRADREAARATWAPALNTDWLRAADLLQTARIWGAAMPYADRAVPWYEPAAATAMRKCEERLHELHPYAMSRYDRLRQEGNAPADAMRDAAPFFANAPRAYDRPYVPRPALAAGDGESPAWTAPTPDPFEQTGVAAADAQEARGRKIVAALQERARTRQRLPLGEAEQRTVLETITNLPHNVIDRIVNTTPGATPNDSALAQTTATARPDTSGHPWKHDFPVPIQDVVTHSTHLAPDQAAATSPRASRRSRRGQHRR